MQRETLDINYVDDQADFQRFVVWLHRAIWLAWAVATLSIIITTPTDWPRYWPVAGVAASLLLSQTLVRDPKRAVMLITVGVWLAASASLLLFAGMHSVSVLLYPFVIALSGWVLGRRWLIAITLASLLVIVALGVGEAKGWFTPTPRAAVLLVAGQIVAVLLIIAFLTYVARQGLMISRNRALQLSQHLEQQMEALAQREHELSLLMESVPAAVVSFDTASRVRRCNHQYAAMFGLQPAQVLGRSIRDFVPGQTLSQIEAQWRDALAGKPQHYRRSNLDPSTGQISWKDADVIPEIRDGQVVGLFALVVDVTDQVRAEQEIRSLQSELEQRVEARTAELAEATQRLQQSRDELVRSQAKASLSAMVANVSHELSTPIGNSVLLAGTFQELARTLAQQLEDGQLRKSGLQQLLDTLQQGSQMMQQNLGRAETLMRSFKQVAIDQVSERRRRIDLAETVQEVLSSMAPTLRKTSHRIEVDIDAGIALDSLPGPLGQVLINLINNACLHAFDGIEGGLLRISASADDAQVKLSVSDNGRGIAPDALPLLFKPFYSTKLGQGGSGLGLSIVDNIVSKMLGGRLEVSSTLGRGSCFTISLPRVAPDAEASTGSPDSAAPSSPQG